MFRQALDLAEPARSPVRKAVAAQWRRIMLVGGVITGLSEFSYIGSVFVTGLRSK